MNMATRQSRSRAATEAEIRKTARALLTEYGPEAVTLRAIARDLGVTAPALYRYYRSRDDLIERLRHDVITDLAAELGQEAEKLPEDGLTRFFGICRGFRRWALAHTNEFSLVFASPAGRSGSVATLDHAGEPFGQIFLTAAGRILATHKLDLPSADGVPAELRDDLESFHRVLRSVVAASGSGFPLDKLDLGTTYVMVQFWARLYGHITLEVFGNYPIPLSKPDAVFDALLAELAREIGLSA